MPSSPCTLSKHSIFCHILNNFTAFKPSNTPVTPLQCHPHPASLLHLAIHHPIPVQESYTLSQQPTPCQNILTLDRVSYTLSLHPTPCHILLGHTITSYTSFHTFSQSPSPLPHPATPFKSFLHPCYTLYHLSTDCYTYHRIS